MKKLIALLLVAIMCLSLVACGSVNETSGKKAIVGEWKATDGNILCFNNDGTGNLSDSEFQWTYNKELNMYTIHLMFGINFSLQHENDIRYFEVMGKQFYHADDYEKGAKAEEEAAQNEINSYIEGRTKIEIGKSYDYAEGVTIEFLGATIVDYGDGHVCIDAAFTSESSVKQESIYPNYEMEYKTHCIYDNVNTYWCSSYSIQWGANLGEYCGAEELEPGSTVETRGSVYSISEYTPTLECISIMICCFEFGGTEYYMDLSEYLK
ncbi:MAG: hypothetical protein E7608_05305 [Ruminococcaceae bacterium]|nr:hypothetical protein [Oscillospiraceae bacterium]